MAENVCGEKCIGEKQSSVKGRGGNLVVDLYDFRDLTKVARNSTQKLGLMDFPSESLCPDAFYRNLPTEFSIFSILPIRSKAGCEL